MRSTFNFRRGVVGLSVGEVLDAVGAQATPRRCRINVSALAEIGLAPRIASHNCGRTLGLGDSDTVAAHQRLVRIGDAAGFTGGVSMELSTIRPSVALVVAVLVRAIQTALGAARD